MAIDLTRVAIEGYNAAPGTACPYYDSSPNGMAWLVGAWLKANSRPAPQAVRNSRGYTLRVDSQLFAVANPKSIYEVKP